MLRELLGSRCNGQQAIFCILLTMSGYARSRHYICKHRLAAGYSTCLIEYNNLDPLRSFQVFSTLEQNAELGCTAGSGHY
ncbi:hypothetical protein D3C71_1728500 [compost metagenome]